MQGLAGGQWRRNLRSGKEKLYSLAKDQTDKKNVKMHKIKYYWINKGKALAVLCQGLINATYDFFLQNDTTDKSSDW